MGGSALKLGLRFSRRAIASSRRRRAIAVVACAAALLAALRLLGPGSEGRATAATGGVVVAQTDDAVPARGQLMLGSSPAEAAAETWGIGEVGRLNGGSFAILRFAEGAGWSVSPWLTANGAPPSGEKIDPAHGQLPGSITPNGDGALLAKVSDEAGGSPREIVLVRDPGGQFREADAVPSEGEAALIKPSDESLFSDSRSPLVAALDEGDHAGALVVPVNRSSSAALEDGVLHWDGGHWTREAIEVPPSSSEHDDFRVLAIAASSPGNAWLLGQLAQATSPGGVELFKRHIDSSGTASWWPVVMPGGGPGQPLQAPLAGGGETPVTVEGTGEPPAANAQLLTVTSEGVWVDGLASAGPLTMFLKPGGEESGSRRFLASALASWCESGCTYGLPDALPTGPSRSFAWADPSNPHGFGQRVITGLDEGVSLRLDGESFQRVLALGAGEEGFQDVGGHRGAAFSSPSEGWLGSERMPVHLTLHPAPNRVVPYPTPFNHALLAVAPQPGAPVAALSSQALAVGEKGEVARFTPGQGWQPETLFGAGGGIARPPLRAVAWPTPGRAFAVGELDKQGDPEMWLWRGETGLWEPDPAMPRNFRGNLLGVAFDPTNPSRGYAVGQGGTLLRYGKSWAQDAIPQEVAGASFTSLAFAGSEALVAYRLPHPQSAGHGAFYSGGLLVNDGSGWRVDAAAATALAGGIPWAVAGLPDGGAALSEISAHEEPLVLERDGPQSGWTATSVPYAGGEPPGSLALFREGGALRVVGSGAIPRTATEDFPEENAPPVGFPAQLINGYPPAVGYVRRQTPSGWSDEEHDRDEVGAPKGEFRHYDVPYRPDPTAAVLINEDGSQGWAVGGQLESREGLDSADVSRYPADGFPAPGSSTSAIPVQAGTATFAIGGNAQCAAACADRANAGLGPDVWLSSALGEAAQIPGVRAFFYTGPRVTTGEGRLRAAFVPRARELSRYAQVLASGPIPAFATVSSTDLAGGEGECPFKAAFSGFQQPFGEGPPSGGLTPAGASGEGCTGGQAGYYALDSSGSGGEVRVIVLDDAITVGAEQLAWLANELAAAGSRHEPAIVIGNAAPGAALTQTLVSGSASAYFYDSPEENVIGHLGSSTIPTFGSGTLGYTNALSAERPDFAGHSGLLLVQVGAFEPSIGRAHVTAPLIPAIGELAMEAKDGVLLRRSQPAVFSALARRPRAGCRADGSETGCTTSQYVPIPANCVGIACANANLPEYSFTSSRPDIGDFVQPNLAIGDPHAVLLGGNGKPISDSRSGLFCAYNAGTTVVTISAGGRSASLSVTVQAGSVRRPCGTTKLSSLPTPTNIPAPPLAPEVGPEATPSSTPPSVPPSAVASPSPPPPPPFFVPQAPAAALLPFVPLPVPTPARPTPPSGTSSVEAAQREEEEEEATESVSNQALAYHPTDEEPSAAFILGVIVLAAFAGASVRRRPRRGRRDVRVAPATVNTLRAQRRMSRRS
jgi:hypothetical protein